MSTKTLRKRIALVAVAALGFGVVTGVSANAAKFTAGTLGTVVALTSDTTDNTAVTATQAIGNQVSVVFTAGAGVTETPFYVTTDAGGSIISATNGAAHCAGSTTATFEKVNGTSYANGAYCDEMVGADTATVALTSAAAGTQVVKFQTLSATTGLYTTLAKITVTWVSAASSAAVSAANSTLYAVTAGQACTYGTSKAGDVAAAAANANTKTAVITGTALRFCLSPRNANGDQVTLAATTGGLVSSLGSSANIAAAGQQNISLTGATAPAFGKATITAIMTDVLGYSAVISTEITYYATLSKLVIEPVVGAAYAGADQTTLGGVYTYAAYGDAAAGTLNSLIIGAKGTDSLGNVIDLAANANSTSTSNWTIDSDKVAGTPADRTSDALGATVANSYVAGEKSATKWGTNVSYVNCSTKPEKLTLTAWGKDSDGNWVKSNSISVYCSGATSKVDVTVTGNAVNVMATDENGYPVADNTSVTLAASNGSVVAPSSKSTTDGKFATAATFIPTSTASSSTVTAIIGSKSGTSAAVAGTGTLAGTLADSQAKTDAAIASLIAKINSLSKLIAKIQKKLGVK